MEERINEIKEIEKERMKDERIWGNRREKDWMNEWKRERMTDEIWKESKG